MQHYIIATYYSHFLSSNFMCTSSPGLATVEIVIFKFFCSVLNLKFRIIYDRGNTINIVKLQEQLTNVHGQPANQENSAVIARTTLTALVEWIGAECEVSIYMAGLDPGVGERGRWVRTALAPSLYLEIVTVVIFQWLGLPPTLPPSYELKFNFFFFPASSAQSCMRTLPRASNFYIAYYAPLLFWQRLCIIILYSYSQHRKRSKKLNSWRNSLPFLLRTVC